MNEWISAAVPLIGLVLFLALVYWPEVKPGLQRLHFAPSIPSFRPVSQHRSVAVVPVRRRVRKAIAPNSRKRRSGIAMHVRMIEQPHSDIAPSALAVQRIDIAKRLHDAGISTTLIIECVWQVKRGGGRSFLEARDTFRTKVIDDSTEVDVAA